MSKRIIFCIIGAIVGTFIYYVFFDETTITQAVIFFFTYIVLSSLVDFILQKRRNQNQNQSLETSVDPEHVKSFIEAVGGAKNITSTDYESSRLKVVIVDIDLLDQEKLKALDFSGAYFSGNQLQVTIGSNVSDFSRQIEQVIS